MVLRDRVLAKDSSHKLTQSKRLGKWPTRAEHRASMKEPMRSQTCLSLELFVFPLTSMGSGAGPSYSPHSLLIQTLCTRASNSKFR